jgi:Fic family protein
MTTRFGDASRSYARSHPWLSFDFDLGKLSCMDYVRVGEALAKCDHITYVALPPAVSASLHQLYMVRGVLASVQIEGNTLSEEQAVAHVQGNLHLPESQEYLQQEFDNVARACALVAQEVSDGKELRLTTERILQFNEMVLDGLPPEEDVVPGQIRRMDIVVGSVYKGPPWQDCEYLLDQLCGWLEQLLEDAAEAGPDWRRTVGVVRAILAHLYLAWIHPFGNGNGRTARLIEFQLLLAAGFPTPACHLLSNYYNKTRTRYYQVLQEASQAEGYPTWRFASYAIRGFVEELHSTLGLIQQHQLGLAWMTMIGEIHLGKTAETANRHQQLLLSLPPGGPEDYTPIAGLNRINPDIAVLYANRQTKTLTRDVNELENAGLIVRKNNAIRPNFERLFAFLPARMQPPPTPEQEMLASLAAASIPNPPA